MYVIRWSENIERDLQRGWSGWMGLWASSLAELLDMTPDVDQYDLQAWIERWGVDSLERYVNQKLRWQYGYDETTKLYGWIHHYGLSCYPLEAESLEEALVEGQELAQQIGIPTGQGHMTIGRVQVVADLGDNWWLLEAEDSMPEI